MLFQLATPGSGGSYPWPGYMMIQFKRLFDSGFVVQRELGNGGVRMTEMTMGVDTTIRLVVVTDLGIAFVRDLERTEL